MNKTTAISKQETLLYALAAAGIIIVILLGMIVYLLSRSGDTGVTDIPAATGIPGAGSQQAPALSPGQIEQSGGQLPAGHVPVQDPNASGSGGAAEGQSGTAPESGTGGSKEGSSSGGETGSSK